MIVKANATDVLIVGAGPTGLTAANLLKKSGVDFRIIDKKSGPTDQTRALVVHAKTLELLDKLGLAEEAVEGGQKLHSADLLKEGKRVGKLSFFGGQDDRTPYPMSLVYEQHRTERLLIRGLGDYGDRIEWSTELSSLSQSSDVVTAKVRRPDDSEETIEAGWLVGSDGASSPVRHSLDLGFEGDTYEESLFLADVEMEWEFESQQVYLDLTREGFYAFFPMPGENRFRLIGSVPDELDGKEAFTAGDVQETFDRYSGVDTTITKAHWTSVYKIHRRMTERFRVGRTFLVGDAAHVHSPAGGQGMNTGIGDAYNLAWKLALVANGQARETLLDSYEAERMPFARSILNGSDKGFSLQVTNNPLTQGIKLTALPWLFRVVSSAPQLSRWAFWFLSQLWTTYKDSPAVTQTGTKEKGPKAGERAPYGFYESGEGIFEILRGTDHHLLLFEGKEPDPARLEASREEIESMLGRYTAPIKIHRIGTENKQLHERYGVKSSSLFLIRPDGHIAYRGRAADMVGLRMYVDGMFVESRESVGRNIGQNVAERNV